MRCQKMISYFCPLKRYVHSDFSFIHFYFSRLYVDNGSFIHGVFHRFIRWLSLVPHNLWNLNEFTQLFDLSRVVLAISECTWRLNLLMLDPSINGSCLGRTRTMLLLKQKWILLSIQNEPKLTMQTHLLTQQNPSTEYHICPIKMGRGVLGMNEGDIGLCLTRLWCSGGLLSRHH